MGDIETPFTIPRLPGTVALAVGTAGAAPAGVINADHDLFGPEVQSGTVGVLGTTEGFWNRVGGIGDLKDEFGNATGVSIR